MSTEDEDRFVPDNLLPALSRNEQDEIFALGLVVNWPMTNSSGIQAIYERFLSTVQTQCFKSEEDAFFCLPFHSLHITVASLFAAQQIAQDNPFIEPETSKGTNQFTGEWHSNFVEEWKYALIEARSHEDWPRRPLELQVESARIDPSAGILTWNDRSGGIELIRQCIARTVRSNYPHLLGHLKIPTIIHSTFVRYKNNPPPSWRLRPSALNAILVEDIIPNHGLFVGSIRKDASETPSTIITFRVDCAKFVNCKIYLQSPAGEDDHTVYLTLPLSAFDR
jgi:hypothetical protein